MHQHDGYAPHSHEVRADHRGVKVIDTDRARDAAVSDAIERLDGIWGEGYGHLPTASQRLALEVLYARAFREGRSSK